MYNYHYYWHPKHPYNFKENYVRAYWNNLASQLANAIGGTEEEVCRTVHTFSGAMQDSAVSALYSPSEYYKKPPSIKPIQIKYVQLKRLLTTTNTGI